MWILAGSSLSLLPMITSHGSLRFAEENGLRLPSARGPSRVTGLRRRCRSFFYHFHAYFDFSYVLAIDRRNDVMERFDVKCLNVINLY